MTDDERRVVLAAAAGFFYSACELYEDDDLDPDDAIAVLKRAFSASDCDDFAWVLHAVTGWQTVDVTWEVPDWGFGHHTLLRAPNGRFLDVNGWSDQAEVLRRCDRRKTAVFKITDVEPRNTGDLNLWDDHGVNEEFSRILGVIRALPHAPFSSPDFQAMSMRSMQGADAPADITPPDATSPP